MNTTNNQDFWISEKAKKPIIKKLRQEKAKKDVCKCRLTRVQCHYQFNLLVSRYVINNEYTKVTHGNPQISLFHRSKRLDI